jgi:3-methyladenine DNA glycosylase AlkD
MVATYQFIKHNQFNEALRIAEILLYDTHDLIQKAVGWMLREVGNRSVETEEQFLDAYAATMPRTMLRYAIEKFPPEKRIMYLHRAKDHGIKKAAYAK